MDTHVNLDSNLAPSNSLRQVIIPQRLHIYISQSLFEIKCNYFKPHIMYLKDCQLYLPVPYFL